MYHTSSFDSLVVMHLIAFIIIVLNFWIIKCHELSILNKTNYTDIKCYSSNDYNLTIYYTDSYLNPTVRQRLSELYFKVYPSLVNRFNPDAPRSIHLYIDDENKDLYWGLAVNSEMIINAYRLRNPTSFPRYYYIFLHELAHLVQQYTTRNLADVKWLGEGLADYVRYTYGSSIVDSDWPLPDYSNQQAFNDGYKVTARFLIWLEYKYNSSVIDQLDKGLRDVTYNQNSTWKQLTGKSIEQLWIDYAQSPNLIRNIPFINTTINMTTKVFEINNKTALKTQFDEKIFNITDSIACA